MIIQFPVVSGCPASQTVNTGVGRTTCDQEATWTEPTATDNCGGALPYFTRSHAPGATFPVGTTTVTYVYKDAAGNTTNCAFNITVVDNTVPVVSGCPASQTVNTGVGRTTCDQEATWTAPTATDNCGGALPYFTRSHAPGATFPVGTTTVTYVYKDAAGNTTNCAFNITVVDNTVPVVSGCPASQTVNTGVGRTTCDQEATWTAPTATDNCGGALPYFTRSHAPGATFPVGTTTVTYVFKDAAGNITNCTFNITVVDNTIPVVNCPSSPVMLCYSSSGNYTIPLFSSSDNCGGTLTTTYTVSGATPARTGTGNNASGAYSVGISTITWTVTDTHGNTNTCSTTVNVNKPLVATVADQYAVTPGGSPNTIYLGYGASSLTYTATVAPSPNNGSGTGYTYQWKRVSPSPANLGTAASQNVSPNVPGTYVYSVTVTDSRGCTTTVNKTVYVVDARDENKVWICHNGMSLSVASPAVAAHLAHGDQLGKCAVNPITRTEAPEEIPVVTAPVVNNPKLKNRTELNYESFKVIVAPNPTTTEFKIRVESSSNELISIRVVDAAGRVRAIITGVHKNQLVTIGQNYIGGNYFAEVIQGANRKTVKLIKL